MTHVINEPRIQVLEHVPLAPFTTLRLGGEARYYVSCSSDGEIMDAVRFARGRTLRVGILGGGSNLIVRDEGFDGLVLRVHTTGIIEEGNLEDRFVTVAAGEHWDRVVEYTVERGLGGMECLSGIPGSTGATPIQNVGAYGQEVSESIVEVRAIDLATLEPRIFRAAECGFGYRTSRFKEDQAKKFIITAVKFRLSPEGVTNIAYAELQKELERSPGGASAQRGVEALRNVRKSVLALRKMKSMVIDPADPNSRSVGSFFTNPIVSADVATALKSRWPDLPVFPAGNDTKLSAAWLVEHAGFRKGYAVNGAAISDNHALALVNRGTTTRDLLSLAEKIRDGVHKQFSILLEREPVILE